MLHSIYVQGVFAVTVRLATSLHLTSKWRMGLTSKWKTGSIDQYVKNEYDQ
jgi:hypothetical protein